MTDEKKNPIKMNMIYIALAIIIVGGGAFYGGLAYGKKSGGSLADLKNLTPQEQRQKLQSLGLFGGGANGGARGGFGRSGGNAAGGAGGQFDAGQIIAKDDKSVTVKSNDGSSKIIFLSASTEISKSATGTPSDLNVGEQVTINGTANADGSLTASAIQLRPQLARPGQ
jgi:hypothetical protein